MPDYCGIWGNRESIITPLGTLKSTSLAPCSMIADILKDTKRIVLIHPVGLKDFYPDLIIKNLKQTLLDINISIRSIRVEHFGQWYQMEKNIPSTDYAAYWRTDKGLRDLDRIIRNINDELAGSQQVVKTAVIFPGLVVDNKMSSLFSGLPFKVIEMVSFPPSPRGQHLFNELKRIFKNLGGEIVVGASVTRIEADGNRCRRVIVNSKGHEISLTGLVFVLATGGIFGGGIKVTPTDANEEAFDLPLYVPDTWTKPEFIGDQPYTKIGVEVNHQLRPVYPLTEKQVFDNVIVIGRTMAHWDPWTENCGGGVSITSGYFAGGEI